MVERPENKYRFIGLVVAVIVLVCAFIGSPTWWNDFH